MTVRMKVNRFPFAPTENLCFLLSQSYPPFAIYYYFIEREQDVPSVVHYVTDEL